METKNTEQVKIKLDEAALKTITTKVKEELATDIASTIKAAFTEEKELKQKEVEASEKIVNKAAGAPAILKSSKVEKESHGLRLVKALQAYRNGDSATLKEYNQYNMELRAKAGYGNTDTDADGGFVAVDPDFEAEVEKIASSYGVWSKTSVRRLVGDSVKTNKKGSGVTLTEVGQGASIAGTKLSIEQLEASLRKFAGIAPFTYEMSEDAAIDFRQTLIEDFAEEDARIMDTMVLTDTNATYPGILRAANTVAVSVGSVITDVTWDDLLDARHSIPTRDIGTGVYVLHPTVFNVLLKQKDSEGRYQSFPTQVGSMTPWGDTILFSDVMPSTSTVGDSNEPYIVYGNLSRIKTYVKQGLRIEDSNEATVDDADGSSVNLWQQDMRAVKIVRRAVVLQKFPEAFAVIGTGTVS